MQIEDGAGSGRRVEVTPGNRLKVYAVTETEEAHATEEGDSFSVAFSVTPTGPADCFLYIKNESNDDLVIEGFGIWLAANEYVDVVIGDTGTPVGGTDITPVNLNAGSGNAASGTFESGVDITGLARGSTAYRIYHASSQETKYTNFEQDIHIPKNYVLSLYVQTGATALAGFIDMYYHTDR